MKRGEPVARVLRILELNESTYYERRKRAAQPDAERVEPVRRGRPVPGYAYNESGEKVCDEQIQEWLLLLLEGEEHVYGYKLLARCIRKQYGVKLNKKKAYRMCKALGILQKKRQRLQTHPRRLPRNHTITASNQLWQMDIKYGYALGQERFFFVLSIIDVFDRVVVGQYRGPVCEAKHAVQTLGIALQQRLQPGEALPIIRTDNGPQFVSKLFQDMCECWDMVHERIPPRTPNMNAYIESFHSILERCLFSNRTFMTLEEAYEALDQFMDFYNNRKMHGSLKNMAPTAFAAWVKTLDDASAFYRSV
ncbi:IS3 family transposase [Cohnella hashimotonis]|uniref:IS3 family transposase n=1 Tax=Cohnella hashimotonis TaxID=2826895 RepID=A0ABT6T9R4_9BACL|nr:IS3 family transposase [Cohnella hashimotonis]MDI4648159.1 IS3 family transposase [Cohnella hashimotonis]MDI4648341.1 IS3 family transposase [Cohnella hashimotonis]